MSKLWKLVAEAKEAQAKIISDVKGNIKQISNTDANEFMSPQFMSIMNPAQQDYHNLSIMGTKFEPAPEPTSTKQSKEQTSFIFIFGNKQIRVQLPKESNENKFDQLIINVQQQMGRKLSIFGVNKVIRIIKDRIQQYQKLQKISKSIAKKIQTAKINQTQFQMAKGLKTAHTTVHSSFISHSKIEIRKNKQNVKNQAVHPKHLQNYCKIQQKKLYYRAKK